MVELLQDADLYRCQTNFPETANCSVHPPTPRVSQVPHIQVKVINRGNQSVGYTHLSEATLTSSSIVPVDPVSSDTPIPASGRPGKGVAGVLAQVRLLMSHLCIHTCVGAYSVAAGPPIPTPSVSVGGRVSRELQTRSRSPTLMAIYRGL